MGEIRRALATGEALDVLGPVSSLVDATDPRNRNPFARESDDDLPSLSDLISAMARTPGAPAAAILAGLRVLAGDEARRLDAERALADRTERLPRWLADLDRAEVGEARELVHRQGDGDNLLLELRLAGGKALTVVVYVDHNLGSVAKDAFVIPDSLTQASRLFQEVGADPHTTIRPLDRADARARITEAIDWSARTVPPFVSDTWPMARPLVEWVVSLLPTGGRGYERREWTESKRGELADAFMASPLGAGYADPDHRDLLDSVLWFGTDYGPGDPLRWSPTAVEILLLDWVPRKIAAPRDYLEKLPALLRAFVRYCDGERAMPEDLTEATLAMVDLLEADYREAVGSPRLQGPLALLAAAGAYDPGEDDESWFDPDAIGEAMLEQLAHRVGGMSVLEGLDTEPLPDEPLDLIGVPDDIAERVTTIAALADGCCDALFDGEARTATRRLVARVARSGPEGIRRPGTAETAAAALCWLVARENDLIGSGPGRAYAKDLMAHFGRTGSPSSRAGALLRAAGLEGEWGQRQPLGPGVLVSSHRRHLIELRDRYRTLGDDLRNVGAAAEEDDDEGATGRGGGVTRPASGPCSLCRTRWRPSPSTSRARGRSCTG